MLLGGVDRELIERSGRKMECASSDATGVSGHTPERGIHRQESVNSTSTAGKTQVREAIEKLPLPRKEAYLQAQKKVPDLVAKESPEGRFLVVEDGNAEKAASRLAAYWENRLDIFGEDRAFLPMDQTGTGALGPLELDIIQSSALVNAPKDREGRPVVVVCQRNYGPGQIDADYDDARVRQAFYIFSVASEQPVAQSKGIVCIGSLVGKFRPHTNSRVAKAIQTMPIRHFEMHGILLPSNLSFAGRISWSVVDMFLQHWGGPNRFVVHRGETDEGTASELAEYGIERSSIPEWLGGTWTLQLYHEWNERRLYVERQRKMTGEEKEVERKRRDAERAKKRRQNTYAEIGELQVVVDNLARDKENLEKEGSRLELLLTLARSQIPNQAPTAGPISWPAPGYLLP